MKWSGAREKAGTAAFKMLACGEARRPDCCVHARTSLAVRGRRTGSSHMTGGRMAQVAGTPVPLHWCGLDLSTRLLTSFRLAIRAARQASSASPVRTISHPIRAQGMAIPAYISPATSNGRGSSNAPPARICRSLRAATCHRTVAAQ